MKYFPKPPFEKALHIVCKSSHVLIHTLSYLEVFHLCRQICLGMGVGLFPLKTGRKTVVSNQDVLTHSYPLSGNFRVPGSGSPSVSDGRLDNLVLRDKPPFLYRKVEEYRGGVGFRNTT